MLDNSQKDDELKSAQISRRTFMTQVTVIAGGVVGLGLAVPVFAGLVPSRYVLDPGIPQWYPLNADEFAHFASATDDPMKITFPKKSVDGYLTGPPEDFVWGVKMTPAQEAQFKADRPDVFELPNSEVKYAVPVGYKNIGIALFSPICPHLGCRFNWDKAAQIFLCPCHGSTYTKFGKHMAGPANRGMDPLPFRDKSGIAEVTWINFAQTTADRLIVSYK